MRETKLPRKCILILREAAAGSKKDSCWVKAALTKKQRDKFIKRQLLGHKQLDKTRMTVLGSELG